MIWYDMAHYGIMVYGLIQHKTTQQTQNTILPTSGVSIIFFAEYDWEKILEVPLF